MEQKDFQEIYNSSFNHGLQLAGGDVKTSPIGGATKKFDESWLVDDREDVVNAAQSGIDDGLGFVKRIKEAAEFNKGKAM